MNSNDQGWDDEAAALRKPELYRCQWCRKAFDKSRVRMIIANQGKKGIFYCLDCLVSMKPEGCPFVAYNDPGRYDYVCETCPLPDLICDLRRKTLMRMVSGK